MSYVVAIKTAIFVFPLVALLFTIPFILVEYHKYGSINFLRSLIVYSFILYLITVYFLIILPLPNKETIIKPTGEMIKLVPFGFIKDFIRESSFVLTNPHTYLKALKEPCFYIVIFNIFMTIPFGMYLRYYFKCNMKKTIVLSFILSLFFELTQLSRLYFVYPYQYRVFDVDDLLMNTLGGLLGFLIMGLIKRLLPTRDEIDKKSFEKGRVVSGFRRITIFNLDLFIYIFITLFISLFIKFRYLKYLVFIVYYIVISYIFKGRTIGSAFVNVRLEYPNYRLVRSTLRIIFLYFYYFYLPYKLIFIVPFFKNYLKLDTSKTIWLLLINLFIIFIFYLGNIITILKKKIIYYDFLFKVTYKSTIEEERCK